VVLSAAALGACAPPPVDLRRVQRIETERRLAYERPGHTLVVKNEPVVIRGERLRRLIAGARCREGTVLWKGGIAATLVLRDGSRVKADGFSFYGRFLRIHHGQWCVLPEALWRSLWQTPPAR
jgi:hypothetical protein